MFRPDAGVVESRRDGVRVDDLSGRRLEKVGLRAVQDADAPAADARGVFARREPLAARLDADERHGRVFEEAREQPHRVRAAADAGDRLVRQLAVRLEALPPRLLADDALEVAHHLRIGRRAGDRADHVERVVAVRRPVADRLVHRVLERRAAFAHGVHLRAEHLHARDVRGLPRDVDRAHEDLALHAEERGDRRRRDAVHARARLGDETRLAHAPRQQRLSDRVVHLVRARVVEVFALEDDPRAAKVFREPPRVGERTLPSDVMDEDVVHFGLERRIALRVGIGLFEFMQRRHQCLRDILTAIDSVVCFHGFLDLVGNFL